MAKSRTENQSSKRRSVMGLGKQYAIGFFVLLTVLAFSTFYIFDLAAKPYETAIAKATDLAKQYADIQETSQVAIYNGETSYYSVLGKQSNGTEVAVLIPQESSDILVYPMGNGISTQEAEQVARDNGATTIDKVTFGYAANQPIWEVKSGTAYYLIGFESGQLVKKEGL